MDLNDFLAKLEQSIESLSEDDLRLWIRDYARRLPEENRSFFLESFSPFEQTIDKNKIDEQMLWASDWLDEVEDGERVVYRITENDWWDDFELDGYEIYYEDRDDFIPELQTFLEIVEKFVMQHQYEDAIELLYRLFHLDVNVKIVWFYDQSEIDEYDLSMEELFSVFHLDTDYFSNLWLYATVQVESESKFDSLFDILIKQRLVSVEGIQTVGPTELKVESCIDDWIEYLVQREGAEAYQLLENAIQSYKTVGYLEENLLHLAAKHPQLYLHLLSEKISLPHTANEFEPLALKRKIQALGIFELDEIKRIVEQVDQFIDDKLTLGSEIMEVGYEISKREENFSTQAYYRKRAFKFRSSIVNFLRLRLYLEPDEMAETIRFWENLSTTTNGPSFFGTPQRDNYLFYNENSYGESFARVFFIEDFKKFYEMSQKNNLGYAVPLFLLLLNKDMEFTQTMSALLPYVTKSFIYSNRDLYYFTEELKGFKKSAQLAEALEEEILTWLNDEIAKRVEAILTSHHRSAYYQGVELLLAYGEVIESRGVPGARAETARIYRSRYRRFSRFIRELEERM